MNPIKAARLAAGYTQRGLANLSSISADYIKCLETGQRDFSKCKPETIARLTSVPGMERCMQQQTAARVDGVTKYRVVIKDGSTVKGTVTLFAPSPGRAIGEAIDKEYGGKEPPRGASFVVQEVKR